MLKSKLLVLIITSGERTKINYQGLGVLIPPVLEISIIDTTFFAFLLSIIADSLLSFFFRLLSFLYAFRLHVMVYWFSFITFVESA